jgi:hypothetical protein
VRWINRASNDSYRKLNVAPVYQNSEPLVRNGKIKSWVNYFLAHEIARIDQVCTTPEGVGGAVLLSLDGEGVVEFFHPLLQVLNLALLLS